MKKFNLAEKSAPQIIFNLLRKVCNRTDFINRAKNLQTQQTLENLKSNYFKAFANDCLRIN